MPPRKAISVPERRRAKISAFADVRVKRGSTWMNVAPFIAGSLNPFKRNRMVLGNIAAHIQNNIGVSEIDIMVCHGAATERLCQSRNSCAVSYTGLMFDIDKAERSQEFLVKPAFFIVHRCAADRSDTIRTGSRPFPSAFFSIKLLSRLFLMFAAILFKAHSQLTSFHLSLLGAR